jgi:hypothetical protein
MSTPTFSIPHHFPLPDPSKFVNIIYKMIILISVPIWLFVFVFLGSFLANQKAEIKRNLSKKLPKSYLNTGAGDDGTCLKSHSHMGPK